MSLMHGSENQRRESCSADFNSMPIKDHLLTLNPHSSHRQVYPFDSAYLHANTAT
jgi:hypothetical protein